MAWQCAPPQCHPGCGPPVNIGCGARPIIEWVQIRSFVAGALTNRAVVGGHGYNSSPLWVIRTRIGNNVIPGKLDLQCSRAFVAWEGQEHCVETIEVCCARPENIIWIKCRDGNVPPQAVKGGWTACGETLYIGRAWYEVALIPGKIQPSLKVISITQGGRELCCNEYEVLCTVG